MSSIYTSRWNKKGNAKLGPSIWSYSKLAGGGKIKNCQGSCPNCEGCYNAEHPEESTCYVFTSYRLYHNVVDAHIRNTNIMRNDMAKAFEELDTQIKRAKKKPTVCRIFASGDLETSQELKGWFGLATKNPNTKFYMYTKSCNVLNEVLPNTKIPKNLYINVSIWHESNLDTYNKYKKLKNVRAFVYMDDYDYSGKIKINGMCPAYSKDKRGMNHDYSCETCGLCFQEKVKVVGCWEH